LVSSFILMSSLDMLNCNMEISVIAQSNAKFNIWWEEEKRRVLEVKPLWAGGWEEKEGEGNIC
jgi:hypothetical protein